MIYRVQAYNTATASENKIHDDTIAARLGFGGGLVPGVDVYAYMTHPVVELWGREWLERGAINARFLQPVYDGEVVEVSRERSTEDADSVDLVVRNAAGDTCAVARASLPEQPASAPDPGGFPHLPLPEPRPPASPKTLPPGKVLGALDVEFRAADAPQYLGDVRESLPLYMQEGVAHPGYLLRFANYVLAASVKLGPWIHAGSDVQHRGVVSDGEHLSTRARVCEEYEKKEHRFVELDVLIVGTNERPLLSAHHTAIYEPRQLRPVGH
jgi:acyl dehydratase